MFGLSHDEEERLLQRLSLGVLFISIPTFLVLYFVIHAPWGKTRANKAWLGPMLPARLSWIVFESPNLVWAYVCWSSKREDLPAMNSFLLLLFVMHYIQRAILYPLCLSSNTKTIPALVVLAAFLFCSVNGYLQAQSLCQYRYYPDDWYRRPQLRLGLCLFSVGFGINVHSDAILRRLRSVGKGYQIPRGALFEYVSNPHYAGEILEWAGYALCCNCSLETVAFLVFTAANLVPRGVSAHKWYQSTFTDYPLQRKAVIPFLW